ncbi:MAG: hypothetical protein LWW98_02775 [Deltaproteobacteria bacterium]|nr:hypothetical protein [Deltaproteobacteria bacterium]
MVVNNFQIDVDNEKLLRFFGASGNKNVSPAVQQKIDRSSDRLEELITPQINFNVKPLASVKKGGVLLQNQTWLKSPKLSRTLRPAKEVCFFIATIGHDLERKVSECMEKNQYADAYVLDTMGSLVVEDVTNQFHLRMERHYQARNQAVTLRFSPGYCDWSLREQSTVFNQFEDSKSLGVTLSNSCLMTPRKSVSGVFGIVPKNGNQTIADYNPCTNCSKTDCIARRK